MSATISDCMSRLDAARGTIPLARNAVFDRNERDDDLTAAWCALDLACQELSRLRDDLEELDSKSRREETDPPSEGKVEQQPAD